MKRVLLTGANGYIGKYAAQFLLERGFQVHAVSSKPNLHSENDNLIWHQANLLDEREVENLIVKVRPQNLLHLAWFVEHGKFWHAPENLDWIKASLNLAKSFARNDGERFVMSGTCAEYDWTKEEIFDETTTALRPQTLYGASKLAAFLTLEKFFEVTDISFAHGRIFFPFGANEPQNRLVPSVIRSILQNKPAKTSHGEQIRDFMFVENVAEAFVQLLDSNVTGAINIASGEPIAIKTVVTTIADIMCKPQLLQIGAIEAAKNEPARIVANTKRLREEVKFTKENNLKQRLIETVNYWQNDL